MSRNSLSDKQAEFRYGAAIPIRQKTVNARGRYFEPSSYGICRDGEASGVWYVRILTGPIERQGVADFSGDPRGRVDEGAVVAVARVIDGDGAAAFVKRPIADEAQVVGRHHEGRRARYGNPQAR